MANECPVCLENYENEGDRCPKLLSCSHTLCVECLRQLIQQPRRLRCPECRTPLRKPSNGASGFPTNRYILQNLDLTERSTRQERERSNDNREHLGERQVTNEGIACEPYVQFCLNTNCR